MKIYDVVAVVGEYTTQDQQIKNRYKTVGEFHRSKEKNKEGKYDYFLLLDKSFNLMAVKQKDVNDDKVFLSLYPPKAKEEKPQEQAATMPVSAEQQAYQAATAKAYQAAKNGDIQAGAGELVDDEIPF